MGPLPQMPTCSMASLREDVVQEDDTDYCLASFDNRPMFSFLLKENTRSIHELAKKMMKKCHIVGSVQNFTFSRVSIFQGCSPAIPGYEIRFYSKANLKEPVKIEKVSIGSDTLLLDTYQHNAKFLVPEDQRDNFEFPLFSLEPTCSCCIIL